MHIALVPCLVCAAVGAAGGWLVRDREYFKSKDEQSTDVEAADDTAKEEGK